MGEKGRGHPVQNGTQGYMTGHEEETGGLKVGMFGMMDGRVGGMGVDMRVFSVDIKVLEPSNFSRSASLKGT